MDDFKKAVKDKTVKNNPRIDGNISKEATNALHKKHGTGCEEYTVHVETLSMKCEHFDFPLVTQEWESNFTENRSRFFGPSETWHCQKTGALVFEEYRRDDTLHRANGPAVVFYDRDTGAIIKQHFFVNGTEMFPEKLNLPEQNF